MSEINPIPQPIHVPHNKTLMGVLCYMGPLLVIPYVVARKDSFVAFHLRQGLVLLSIELIAAIGVLFFVWELFTLVRLVNLGTSVLALIGIVNVIQGHEKELPLVGQFSSYFTL